jgi:hypothetical protein
MELVSYVKLILVFLILFCASQAIAGYSGPSVIINGTWGQGTAEFGIYYNSMRDDLPERFFIKTDDSVIVRDIVNGRRKIYVDGQIEKIIDCAKTPAGDWNEECNILGEYLFTNKDGNFWTKDGGQYKLTTPIGELLATYDQKPLELGLMTARRRAGSDNKYVAIVQYEDRTYHVILDREWKNFVRDQNDFLYFFDDYTAHDPVSNDSTVAWFVAKFDTCGNRITKFMMPISEYEPLTPEQRSIPAAVGNDVRNEYGPPVIGPDGSVYAWKRTPDTYSILKWTWVDDPADPQPGPDAPTSLTVTPSSDGLNLVWVGLSSGCVDGFEIERATSAGGVTTILTMTAPDVFTYKDTSALPGITYFYKIRARSGGWYSPYSAEVNGVR